MSEIVQGVRCKSCGETVTIDDTVVIRENPLEGRVHIQTCLACVVRINGLEMTIYE